MPKKLDLHIHVQVYENEAELPVADALLLSKARESCSLSYSPYSHFEVGAALLLANGEVVKGANQENAAYPSTLCAERTAVFWAGANHPNTPMKSIAVAARPAMGDFVPVTPCGGCRQTLLEYEEKQGTPIRVIMGGHNGQVYVFDSVSMLLPLKFSDASLVRGKKK